MDNRSKKELKVIDVNSELKKEARAELQQRALLPEQNGEQNSITRPSKANVSAPNTSEGDNIQSENSSESQAHFSLEEEELSDKEKAKLYKQKRVRELITSVAGILIPKVV